MDPSIIAYASQKSLFDRLDILSNNVANASTSGFKSDLAVYMKPTGKINNHPNPLPKLATAVDLAPGGLRQTGRQLDVAITGNGFFQVESPLGTRYTRAGSFFMDSSGALVTKEGYAVSGDGGPITLDPTDTNISIGEDGTIVSATDTGGIVRGRLGVVKFDDPSSLKKVGTNIFVASNGATSAEARTDYTISQGMVEESNVNQVEEMTNLIDVSRSVQNLARIIQDENQRIRSAVQRIAGTSS